MDEITGSHGEQLPLHSAGDRLRLAREQAGMTIGQVAAETRIPQRHLEVIEKGDFDALPARTYATGFARTYAKAVGLDPAEIVEEVRAELAMSRPAVHSRAATFEPGDPARVPSRGLALLSLLAIALLSVGGYMFYDRVLAPGAGPGSLLDEQRAAQAAMATPAPSAPATPQGGQVVFTALEDGVWVKFYDAGGTQLMQKEMAKGETYAVPADAEGPQVWTGRPDALAITVGGRPVARLSDTQRVVKDVPVSAEALVARDARQPQATSPAPATTQQTQASAARSSPARTARPAPTRSAAPAPRRTSAPRPRPTASRPAAVPTVSTPVVQPVPTAAGEAADTQG
ncbi:helix-turn-helix domain-containing protein [Tsuneonella amylolytica]|uniref:helix-turn-helix domain-containing protein n=1 Tax=Tsuneonella amylolytica TaxID=2338327 RepID=UPI000EA99BF5|nr:helix-turn-helix domain-containing protein [Tsuneonella amylolytica]